MEPSDRVHVARTPSLVTVERNGRIEMVARASSLSGIKNPHMRRRAECTRRRRRRRRCTRRMFFFSSLLCRVNNCHSCSFFSKKTEPSTAALRGFNSHRTPPLQLTPAASVHIVAMVIIPLYRSVVARTHVYFYAPSSFFLVYLF